MSTFLAPESAPFLIAALVLLAIAAFVAKVLEARRKTIAESGVPGAGWG